MNYYIVLGNLTLYSGLGDLFSQIAVRERAAANEAFTVFAESHRNYWKAGMEFQKNAAPVRLKIIIINF